MRTSILFSSLLISMMIFSVSAEADPKKPASARLALNWKPEPEFGGFYAAEIIGAYQRAGLKVEILPGGVGTPVVQMVAAGSAEFGIASADEVVIARQRGSKLVALFTVYQTNPQGIMVRTSRGTTSLADVFSGGKLAMQKGLPYSLFLEKKYGFSKVQVVPYLGGITQMLSDPDLAQQCFVFAEPILAKRKGLDVKTFLIADAGYNPYTAVVVADEKWMEKNSAVVKGMTSAVREGWEAYLKDPGPANALMGKLNPTMDAETFRLGALAQAKLIQNADTDKNGLGTMTKERWAELASQIKDLGLVKTTEAADHYFR